MYNNSKSESWGFSHCALSRVSIKHFAATPSGLKVVAEAYLKEVDGRRLVFDVVAHDEFEKIAEGENE